MAAAVIVKVHKKSLGSEMSLDEIKIDTPELSLSLLNYGATMTRLLTKNRAGVKENIVVGFENVSDYLAERRFIGSSIGRVAGRIRRGKWLTSEGTVQLEVNESLNHLHGGQIGFDNIFWQYQIQQDEESARVTFSQLIPAKRGNYPGNLEMSISFIVVGNQVTIEYRGISDQRTLLNPTNHSYFNLSGDFTRSVSEQSIQLNASHYLPLTVESLPTGELCEVEGTVFDLRKAKQLKSLLTSSDPQIRQEKGLNHPFVLAGNHEYDCQLFDCQSGRVLRLTTDSPAIVCYTGNHFTGSPAVPYGGIALETQNLPDAVSHPAFATIVLNANQVYSRKTSLLFFTD